MLSFLLLSLVLIFIPHGAKTSPLFNPCTPCPRNLDPVCGSDGTTYDSLCELTESACLSGQNIWLKHKGQCVTTIGFASTVYSVTEGQGYVTVKLKLTGFTAVSLDVSLNTRDGTASSPSDYTAITNQVVTFGPGEVAIEVNITIATDNRVENDETFQASLSTTNTAQIKLVNAITNITIVDDDQAVKSFCVGELDGLYKHPTDCSKYIHCVASRTYISSCPAGLNYNEYQCACDWPANVMCQKISISSLRGTRCPKYT